MNEGKLCGNCAGDHKYLDCPYINDRITKVDWEQFLKEREIIKKIEQACKEWMNAEMSDYTFASYIQDLFGIEL